MPRERMAIYLIFSAFVDIFHSFVVIKFSMFFRLFVASFAHFRQSQFWSPIHHHYCGWLNTKILIFIFIEGGESVTLII